MVDVVEEGTVLAVGQGVVLLLFFLFLGKSGASLVRNRMSVVVSEAHRFGVLSSRVVTSAMARLAVVTKRGGPNGAPALGVAMVTAASASSTVVAGSDGGGGAVTAAVLVGAADDDVGAGWCACTSRSMSGSSIETATSSQSDSKSAMSSALISMPAAALRPMSSSCFRNAMMKNLARSRG